jgi:hypothetical protein
VGLLIVSPVCGGPNGKPCNFVKKIGKSFCLGSLFGQMVWSLMGFALAFAPNPRSVLPLLSAGQFKCLFDDFYVFGIFYHFIFFGIVVLYLFL